MKNYSAIPDEIKKMVLEAKSIAIWPIDESPMTDSYQAARYFQDRMWDIYPVHDYLDRILEVQVYRDIRLIPDDYDILLIFCDVDRLPETVNAIFNADYIPPLLWTGEGIIDLETIDRLNDAGILNMMDTNLVEFYIWLTDEERTD